MTERGSSAPGPRLIHGTSGWHEKSWVGPFYPDGTRQADWLPWYATQFSSVEVDSTYYGVPRRSTVENRRARTPDGFLMCPKFPRGIVHGGQGRTPDGDVVLDLDAAGPERDRFLDTMSLLGDRLGPLVLQFPYFARSVFPSQDGFLGRLDRFLESLPTGCRYAVEVRNRSWMNQELLDVLRAHEVAFVWTELPKVEHPADLSSRLDLVTADFIYGRLIGDRRATDALTSTWDRIVIDRGANLRRWAQALARVVGSAPRVFLFANNHYAGHGPDTIRTLVRMVKEETGEG